MKIEKTTKITLETADQHAVNAAMDIVNEIHDKMEDWDVLVVYGERYDRDFVETVRNFLGDLWHNGDCACEIVEG
jgi:hypothetical protein